MLLPLVGVARRQPRRALLVGLALLVGARLPVERDLRADVLDGRLREGLALALDLPLQGGDRRVARHRLRLGRRAALRGPCAARLLRARQGGL